ncbi:MAG: PilX N-terminal domain-containing pilus assembly protein [Patescibacteria group bacterium]|nr:PilX N-terminal domain-containing pilus assembly protein [Patescibacteria group bacterium]
MKYRLKHHRNLSTDDGFASIVIAIVLVLVLSLLTVGFAQLMRREQRSALDKRLSNQAYYAAEAGINDAAKAINAGYPAAKTTCGPLGAGDTNPGAIFMKNNLVPNSGTSYTCLLVDPTPSSVEFGAVDYQGVGQSKIVYITGVNPANDSDVKPIGSFTFSWQNSNGTSTFVPGTSHDFLNSDWPYAGVLRVALTPLSSGSIDRDSLINGTSTMFMYPNDSATGSMSTFNSSDYIGDGAGGILDGNCKTSNTIKSCNVKIQTLGQANYVLNLRSIYKTSQVSIRAFDTSGSPLSIKNAQTVVDSTGKSQDVLRRIQVHIPSHSSYNHPDYALETMSGICKQLNLVPASVPDTSSSNSCDPANP